MRLPAVAVILSLALAGCQPAYVDGEPNTASPYYEPPTGSVLELNHTLEVPARGDRVYFQQGRILLWHEVNEYRGYCALRVRDKQSEPQRLEPGRYTVREVSTEHIFMLAARPTVRAAAVAVGFDGNDSSREDYQTLALVLALEGPDDRVQSLACAEWGIPQVMPRVTVDGMGRALGSHATLTLGG